MEQHGDAKLTDLLQTIADCPKARSASVHDRCRAVFERASLIGSPTSVPGRGPGERCFSRLVAGATTFCSATLRRGCGSRLPSFSRRSCEKAPALRTGACGPRNWETDGMRSMSRRKALSLLGLGAAFGFTLPAVLAPLRPKHRRPPRPPPRPLRPPGPTG